MVSAYQGEFPSRQSILMANGQRRTLIPATAVRARTTMRLQSSRRRRIPSTQDSAVVSPTQATVCSGRGSGAALVRPALWASHPSAWRIIQPLNKFPGCGLYIYCRPPRCTAARPIIAKEDVVTKTPPAGYRGVCYAAMALSQPPFRPTSRQMRCITRGQGPAGWGS